MLLHILLQKKCLKKTSSYVYYENFKLIEYKLIRARLCVVSLVSLLIARGGVEYHFHFSILYFHAIILFLYAQTIKPNTVVK